MMSTVMFYCIFMVNEDRRDKKIPKVKEFLKKILSDFKYVLEPSIIIPLSYLCLTNLIPDFGAAEDYLVMAKGGWTVASLGLEDFCFRILESILLAYFINYFRKISLEWLFIFYGISCCFYGMVNFATFYCSENNFYLLFALYLISDVYGSTVSGLSFV